MSDNREGSAFAAVDDDAQPSPLVPPARPPLEEAVATTANDDADEDKDVIISCENIHKTYLLGIEGVPALRGVSVDVFRGEFMVIYGTSGGGKSTLLNVLGTIDVPTKGNLAMFDRRITERTPDNVLALLRCNKVGFVFQSFNLLSTMTAEENVTLPMIIRGELSRDEMRDRARQLLTDVGLGHRLDHYPSMLSGGEQQRVTIARALSNEPEILLLDEPTGDLDTKNTNLVMSILLNLNRSRGLTMIAVTHDVYMKQYANRVIYLRDGKLNRIEKIGDEVRNAASQALVKRVESDAAGAEDPNPPRLPRRFVRRPEDYKTYSEKASPDAFRQHDNPQLFEKLFAKQRQTNLKSGQGSQTGADTERTRNPAAATPQ